VKNEVAYAAFYWGRAFSETFREYWPRDGVCENHQQQEPVRQSQSLFIQSLWSESLMKASSDYSSFLLKL
jgi:hypothetical protein